MPHEACEFTECEGEATHVLNDGNPFGDDIYLCAHHAAVAEQRGFEPVALAKEN